MTRVFFLVALMALAGCLPTRNRVDFEKGTPDEDTGVTDSGDDEDDGGSEPDPDGGPEPDSGPEPDTGPEPDMAPEPDAGPEPDADPPVDMSPTEDMNMPPDACDPESNQQFCDRLAVECGLYTGMDNCNDPREVNCGGCMGDGVGCSTDNVCVENDCGDNQDNDGVGGADCEDPNCEGQRCGPNPNRTCQPNGECQ